ncbi:2-oxoacid:acceptor oxidoreductase family protein [Hydrogenoanaerobacterium sp.]|uniref:2-oxoacid:acceptor oxidoreductase family protein n=1 Tax=Hydrogenoanaerobacterium sp. TaxID=2953763 RepID=UPI0028A15566|nr:2-oxoacid:acceptor oxidoreductase family protein [Hydrogenoanaerobacterium sp.]
MWEFKFYSRGGQGAVTAAKILINAAILEGKFGQAIPSYGQERKGAPVYTYARIADTTIDVKSYVYHPNCVVCFDPSLGDLGINVTEGIRPNSVLVANSPEKCLEHENFSTLVFVDADKITHEMVGEVPPNMAMLGALAKATGCVSIESLTKAIQMRIPGKAGELNARTCKAAYENA